MVRRITSTPTEAAPDETHTTPSTGFRSPGVAEPDFGTLSIAGITRRRMATLLGVLLAAWIVVVFARQVTEASAATGRAEAMVGANAERRTQIAALEQELQQIQRLPFVLQEARGYGLGDPREIPFSLAAGAPSLPPDAPGSAAARLGARSTVSPLERWLTVLFGAGP